MSLLFEGTRDIGLLILRVFIGWIFIYHSWSKLTNSKGMAAGMGKPQMAGAMKFLGLVEIIGGIALILGFLTELAALGLVVVMLGAIYMKSSKWKTPFSTMKGTGWEFDFVILGAALAIAFIGAGLISLDAFLDWWP